MTEATEIAKLIQENTHSIQRKAAIAWGKGTDHSGHVKITPISKFDLEKTIFSTLEGALPRMVIKAKIAKNVEWDNERAQEIEYAYKSICDSDNVPPVNPKIIAFMVNECDFSMEHADGTFLEHLLFCYDYSALYFSDHSPNVALLHSILGTATNTFAMEAHKIPALFALLTEFEQVHVEAFPSVLRLITHLSLLEELTDNSHRLETLKSIEYHRVIDNKKCMMSAEDLWIQLNYQLMHFVDFLPAANWANHASDPVLQSFVRISDFLDFTGKRMAKVDFVIPTPKGPLARPPNEQLSFGGKLSQFIPAPLKKSIAAKSVEKFSQKIGHSLQYNLNWAP